MMRVSGTVSVSVTEHMTIKMQMMEETSSEKKRRDRLQTFTLLLICKRAMTSSAGGKGYKH